VPAFGSRRLGSFTMLSHWACCWAGGTGLHPPTLCGAGPWFSLGRHGRLAVIGTVNDLAIGGAEPLGLSLGSDPARKAWRWPLLRT